MKKLNIVLVILLCFVTICLQAQKEQKSYTVYAVGFYNLENLFDTCHDEGKNDYEYLTTGANKWTGMKYSGFAARMTACSSSRQACPVAWTTRPPRYTPAPSR